MIVAALRMTGQRGNSENIDNLLNKSSKVSINFLTFNYTNTIDELARDYNNNLHSQKNDVEQVIHIHGTLNEPIVIGVNDVEQFNEKIFVNDFSEYFIKSKVLENHVNNDDLSRALGVIDSSDVIMLFGVSFGVTDKKYWESIIEWLEGSSSRIAVLYDFSQKRNEIRTENIRTLERIWDNSRQKLLQFTDSEIAKNIRKRIYPLYGDEFFELPQKGEK